jgi:DNA-nicking Smr family endonuclease
MAIHMNDKQTLNPVDVELFRRSIGEVVAVKQNTVLLGKPSPTRNASQALSINDNDHSSIHGEEFLAEEFRVSAAELIEYKRSGLQNKVFRKLKRGQLPIVAMLDLHGMSIYDAKNALDRFLARTREFKIQSCARVIHGKGYGSKDGLPKLKQYIQIWLQENKNVLAYSSCTLSDGGSGALYLLLKSCNN